MVNVDVEISEVGPRDGLQSISPIMPTAAKKAWISAGFSKGGQTAMYYRRFYPNDVKGTICFDSPLNFQQQEERIDAFFQNSLLEDN